MKIRFLALILMVSSSLFSQFRWKEKGEWKEAYWLEDRYAVFRPLPSRFKDKSAQSLNSTGVVVGRTQTTFNRISPLALHKLANGDVSRDVRNEDLKINGEKAYLVFSEMKSGDPSKVLVEGMVLEFSKDFSVVEREKLLKKNQLKVERIVKLIDGDLYLVKGVSNLSVFKKIENFSNMPQVNSAMPNWHIPLEKK